MNLKFYYVQLVFRVQDESRSFYYNWGDIGVENYFDVGVKVLLWKVEGI